MNWLLTNKTAVQKICLAATLLALAVVIGLLYRDIQQSRIQACQQQNTRHTATVTVLKQIISNAETQETPAERANARAAYQSALLVISALAPEQNCALVVTH